MLLQEPAHSPYDLRFHLLGFPVRVSWTFWIAGVVFGYGLVQGLDQYFREASPGILPMLLLWNLCLLVSILIHELGHALAFRQNGMHASIVLYHFGGLAIPTGSYSPNRNSGRLTPKQDIWISFAGPLAQITSAAILVAAVKAAGYRLTVFAWMPGPFYKIPGVLEGAEIDSAGLFCARRVLYLPQRTVGDHESCSGVAARRWAHHEIAHSTARRQHNSGVVDQCDRSWIDGGIRLYQRSTVHGLLVFDTWRHKFSGVATEWRTLLIDVGCDRG